MALTLAEELMGIRPNVPLSPGKIVHFDDPIEEEDPSIQNIRESKRRWMEANPDKVRAAQERWNAKRRELTVARANRKHFGA